MCNEIKMDELIVQLLTIAGEIGELHDPEGYSAKDADVDDYDYKIQIGLSQAVVEIFDYDPSKTINWFGHYLIALGMNTDDGRMQTLLYTLDREHLAQFLANEDDSKS